MPCLAPRGVSVHFGRLVARGPVATWDSLQRRAASHVEHIDLCVEMLASVGPAVIVLAHTATSYFLGRDAEAQLLARLSTRYEVPVISALGSVVRRLRTHERSVASRWPPPDDEALTRHGTATIATDGLEVVQATAARPGAQRSRDFETVVLRGLPGARTPSTSPTLDAVFISARLRAADAGPVVGALETDLGKPVFSSASGHDVERLAYRRRPRSRPGHGRLLADPVLR